MGKLALVFLAFLLWIPTAGAEALPPVDWVEESRGIPAVERLFDMDVETTQRFEENASLTISRSEGIGSLYLIFDMDYGVLNLTNEETGEVAAVSTEGMLHYYVDVEACFDQAPHSVTVSFPTGEAWVNELGMYPPGEVPDWVQRWEKIPEGQADLLLLSTHGDDDQLFFAGLLPWYAGEKGYRVQVVYFTDHRNLTAHRVHEMLNGLWAVGVRDYPVFGRYDDYYTFDLEDAYRYYEETGHPRQTLLAYVTELLRRYRPLVAVGHDQAGEYGHGMHQLTADLLKQAVQISGDEEAFPEQLDRYDPWQVPKTYLHLYPENPITMDWDIPLEAFDGMTAYEVTKEKGFPCHASQYGDFAWYFRGADRATEVRKYSPCQYGLYRSTVGEDTDKGDFFENLEAYFQTPAPTEPPQPVQTTPPIQTTPSSTVQPPAQPQPEPEKPDTTGEKVWILFPAVGTAVLTLLTACLNETRKKEKF